MRWFRRPSSAPLWQDEFPVFTADERYVNRRQFTKFLTLTSFGMLVGNLWILARSIFYRTPSFPRHAIASVDEVPVGGVKTFAYPTASVHTFPAPCTTRERRIAWSAPAIRVSSLSPMARCCRDRRSARCRE